jgi:hypothetical protein
MMRDLIAYYDWEGDFKGKMKTFFFPLNLFPILNPVTGIEPCDAGILGNQACLASVAQRALREIQRDPFRVGNQATTFRGVTRLS